MSDGPALTPLADPIALRPWVGIVANSRSGTGYGRTRVQSLIEALGTFGFGTRVAWTPDERKALVELANADPLCHCLVSAGGDGTFGALINECPRVPLTVLPAGTENLFARHFGIRPQADQVVRTIASGLRTRLDLGRIANQRFALMAGIGFDADVVTRHHLTRIGKTGQPRTTSRVAYVEPVLRSSLNYRFPTLTVHIEDETSAETLSGSMVFLFNLPDYALGLPIAPSACARDGMLDLVVFRNPGPFQALRYLWLVFRGLHLDRPGVELRRVRHIRVEVSEPVPVQIDGDPAGLILPGQSPAWIADILPGAIEVLVPPTYPLADAS
jgi:diacylglycerol kinase family enzyme